MQNGQKFGPALWLMEGAGVIHRLPGCGLTGYPLGFHRLVAMHQTECRHPPTNQGVLHVNNNGDEPGLLFVNIGSPAVED